MTPILEPIASKPSEPFSSEEKCTRGLRQIRNDLEILKRTNAYPNSNLSKIQSVLDGTIHTLQTHGQSPDASDRDGLDSLIAHSIDRLNHERGVLPSESDERDSHRLDDHISAAIHLLSDYRRMVMVNELRKQESSSNISKTLDSTQSMVTSEYPGVTSPSRCRPVPYTSANEKGSSETLTSVLIPSKDTNEKSMNKERELNHDRVTSPVVDTDPNGGRSESEWLKSLLSKISANSSSTSSALCNNVSRSVLS